MARRPGNSTVSPAIECVSSGAAANTFPVEGPDEIQVFRTLADARAIKERLADCGWALILSAGILGLELAGALLKMGQQPDMDAPRIAVVQRSAFVGSPFVDAPAAK